MKPTSISQALQGRNAVSETFAYVSKFRLW